MTAGIAVFSIAQTNGASNLSSSGIGGGFRQEGIASWYGTEFDGKPTASGEIFNSNLYTAAHPTLPFGTVLTITNKQNNIRVNVRINDRGPFVAARIVDLSRAAAEVLDMLITGTAPVLLEQASASTALGPAGEAPPAPAIAAATPPAASQGAASPPQAVEVPLAPLVPREEVRVAAPAPVIPQSPAPAPAWEPQPSPSVAALPQQPAPVIPAQPVVPAAPVQPVAQVQTPAVPAQQPITPAVPVQPLPVIPPVAPAPVPPVSAPPVMVPPPVMYSAPPARIIGGIPPAGSTKHYRLQVGAYRVPRNAVESFDKLKNAGLKPAYEQYGELYRVVLAGLRASEIQAIAQILGNVGFPEALIREEN